ncbi:MAG: hypothetical protein HY261_04105 [Chloroflexi bacterium]|nr:hypothetical protein [Chloroflexota bacterium]
MATQQPAQPPKKDALTSFESAVGNAIFALLNECWKMTMLLLKPLEPVLRGAESLWAATFGRVWNWLGATKLLDSLTGTIILGLLILAITILVIRLAV